MQAMTFIFDIGGTIYPIKSSDQNYEDMVPYFEIVEKIRNLKENGAKIVFFTSRNMNTYQGNIGAINANTAKIILAWLDKWEIPYDEIIYGKPWPGNQGFYVDDRAIRPDEFLRYSTEEMDEICSQSRLKEALTNDQ